MDFGPVCFMHLIYQFFVSLVKFPFILLCLSTAFKGDILCSLPGSSFYGDGGLLPE